MTNHNNPTPHSAAGLTRYTVIFVRRGKEQCSPWLYCETRARRALKVLAARYGKAMLFTDEGA